MIGIVKAGFLSCPEAGVTCGRYMYSNTKGLEFIGLGRAFGVFSDFLGGYWGLESS